MKMKIVTITAILSCSVIITLNGQNKDKALFRESKPGFYQSSILKDDREVREKAEPVRVTRTFAEGSEANAVTRMWKKYGVVPEENYNG
jgi:hypothetical protein